MSTDEFLGLFAPREPHEPRDPMKAAQQSMRAGLPRRFYQTAGLERVAEGWRLLLDGKAARTPARHFLTAPQETVAAALAAEWNAQTELINPATMPLTRLINAALDGVAAQADAVRAEITRYAGTDLICYRAEAPAELSEAQAQHWDPLIAWAREALGAPLMLGAGIIHVPQPGLALAQVARAVEAVPSPLPLAALSTVTTLTGSAIIALALAQGRLGSEEAWVAAHVDEDYQARVWGADDEAAARMAARRGDFDAAALVLDATRHEGRQGD
jgi:chaperone required for assembly of F1-ATPase